MPQRLIQTGDAKALRPHSQPDTRKHAISTPSSMQRQLGALRRQLPTNPALMGWLVAALSLTLMLCLSKELGDRYARETEQEALRILHDKTMQDFTTFRDTLSYDLRLMSTLDFSRCTAQTLKDMRKLRYSMLYIHEVRYQPQQGTPCMDGDPLPDLAAMGYRRHRLLSGETLLWNVDQLRGNYPSLVIGNDKGIVLSSSLVYLIDRMSMPAHFGVLMIAANGRRLLGFGQPEPLLEEAKTTPPSGDLLHIGPSLVVFHGPPGMLGIRLLVFTSRENLDREARRWYLAGGVTSLLIAALLGYLVTSTLRYRQSLERELATSLEHALELDYQPLAEMPDGRWLGVEALVRWRRRDGERISPEVFIPQAENSALISKLTQQVIRQLFQELGPTLRARPEFYVSVNLSAEDLRNTEFIAIANALLQKYGVKPGQLVYEITERSLVDIHQAADVLRQLRTAGHRIAVDDFGTGYSSLAYLQHLPVDILKIDKAFIDSIGTHAASCLVAPHIVHMANALNLIVVAEGVEKASQVDALVGLGVRIGQGWHFSKPLSKESLLRRMALAA
ncbi:hypothetical protein CEK28_05860 [Xenophilus sp. AP218F]|nr:hypothetical protein CEK28_05860 [Xenophilus sp. AP218F]